MSGKQYTIDDLSRITGISRRTIRFYVQENLLQGGLKDYSRRKQDGSRFPRTRSVTGLDESVRLNKQLWTLAEEFATTSLANYGIVTWVPSVITDAGAAIARVRDMLTEGALITVSGKRLTTPIDSVCVHGDTAHAVELARALRAFFWPHRPPGRCALISGRQRP